jgi:hypothetical protein
VAIFLKEIIKLNEILKKDDSKLTN